MPSKMRKNSLKKKSFNKKKRQAKTPKMKGGNCSIKNKKNMSGGAPPLPPKNVGSPLPDNTVGSHPAVHQSKTYNTPRIFSVEKENEIIREISSDKHIKDLIEYLLQTIKITKEKFDLDNYILRKQLESGFEDIKLEDVKLVKSDIYNSPRATDADESPTGVALEGVYAEVENSSTI